MKCSRNRLYVIDGGCSQLPIKLNLKDPNVQKACVPFEENGGSTSGDETVLYVQEECKVLHSSGAWSTVDESRELIGLARRKSKRVRRVHNRYI